jgi:hypothetical protein
MDRREIGWGCRVDPVVSGYGPVAESCEYGDEPAGSGPTCLFHFWLAVQVMQLSP